MILDQTHKCSVFEIKGTLHLQGDERGLMCRFDPTTRLGRRLAWDTTAQAVLANYIRQHFNLPRSETGATVCQFKPI